ncbi:MAG TPA: helix-turn-helix domain-containing protein, partial [Pyrinomonadaceae bacterium]
HFLRENAQDEQLPHLTREVWNALLQYNFPGNVRELENALIRAVALSTGNVITLDCLPPSITQGNNKGNKTSAETETLREILGDRPSIEELQRRYLSLILSEVGGNRRRAAEKLGLDRRTIQRLIAKYNLFTSDEDDADENVEAASNC